MGTTFTERKCNQPHYPLYCGGTVGHIDTYFEAGGKIRFLRGYTEGYANEAQEVEELKQQLINNECKYIRFYCHAPIEDRSPLAFLAWVKEHKMTFESFSHFRWIKSKSINAWEFGGNLREYSSAFTYRIFDRALAMQIKKTFSALPILKEDTQNQPAASK